MVVDSGKRREGGGRTRGGGGVFSPFLKSEYSLTKETGNDVGYSIGTDNEQKLDEFYEGIAAERRYAMGERGGQLSID